MRNFVSIHRCLLIVAALLAVSMQGLAQGTLPIGPFSFVINSTYSVPSSQGGAGMLGVLNFDGAGNVSGPYTLELGSGGGSSVHTVAGTFTGTYSSNPDGTGTISMALDVGVNLTLSMVIDDRGRSLELALTGCTGPICNPTGFVVSGVGVTEFSGTPHPVHQRILNGSYGLQSTKSAPTPQASVGVWTFDGAGNVTMSSTFVGPNLLLQNGSLSGTYSVNSDGTGSITVPPQAGSLFGQTWVFVIAEGHSQLLVLQTNRSGDGVVYGIGHIQ